ncbi:MAG: hypothetical protein ACREBC_01005 [Pyrinomonadaceae bacterium]
MAADWNRRRESQELAVAEDFWPFCGFLQEEGLLVGSDERLTTARIGPFRVAHTRYENITRDFVEVLLPATFAGMVDGRLIHGALSGVLTAAGNTFIQLLRRSVSFGPGSEDRLRWIVLIYVKTENGRSRFPTSEQLVQHFSSQHENIGEVIEWLTGPNARPFVGDSSIYLLRTRDDGGLEALV